MGLSNASAFLLFWTFIFLMTAIFHNFIGRGISDFMNLLYMGTKKSNKPLTKMYHAFLGWRLSRYIDQRSEGVSQRGKYLAGKEILIFSIAMLIFFGILAYYFFVIKGYSVFN